MKEIPRRVWLEVNLNQLCENYRKITAAVQPALVLPVLKANAYGLGVLPIASALAECGVPGFGVAEPYEALQLLGLGKEVQILSSILPEEIEPMVEHGVTLPVTDLATAQLISKAAQRCQRNAIVHIKVDTGMGRLGLVHSKAAEAIIKISTLPGIICQGIFSHFPLAYESGSELTNHQMDVFCVLLDKLAGAGITFARCHIANSDAINNFPRACHPPFNMVRSGINLHGSFDTAGKRTLCVKPVLTLKSRLSAVRTLPAGTGIGYGHTCRLACPTCIGTVSVGYADGLPLALSNRGYLLVRGVPCPVLGRVSMDYTTISLAGVPDAEVGDEVTCLGGLGEHSLRVEDWAALKNTHPYEIICSIGSRVEHRFVL